MGKRMGGDGDLCKQAVGRGAAGGGGQGMAHCREGRIKRGWVDRGARGRAQDQDTGGSCFVFHSCACHAPKRRCLAAASPPPDPPPLPLSTQCLHLCNVCCELLQPFSCPPSWPCDLKTPRPPARFLLQLPRLSRDLAQYAANAPRSSVLHPPGGGGDMEGCVHIRGRNPRRATQQQEEKVKQTRRPTAAPAVAHHCFVDFFHGGGPWGPSSG